MATRKLMSLSRLLIVGSEILILIVSSIYSISTASADAPLASSNILGDYPIVFVSRMIPSNGSVYYPQTGSMPGVQPFSRFQVAAPGRLIIRDANGTLRPLIDGSNPTAASLNLIDVSAPDVSYDATKIVFAGLPQGIYSNEAVNSPGAWRIYAINVDGTGLKQITFSDRNIDLSQFGSVASNFTKYDDTDPAWLPDGRIVFSSTRWPSFGMYGAALTSNLYVVNANGANLHRITAERNGAERPVVDPLTGKIVYSRWWRNFRLGTNNMSTMSAPEGGYIMKDGVCALSHQGAECQEAGGLSNLERNSWHLATINPDGTGLAQFAGRSMSTFVGEEVNHAYGGSFAPDGSFYANFFPMMNGTEAAGFGGIRHYQRGANGYTSVIGITTRDENVLQFANTNPVSYGVYVGNYAADPTVLPDGTLMISWAVGIAQDYGLYKINSDGSGKTLIYDNPGTTELRAKPIIVRALPPIIPDKVIQVASQLPPLAQGPYDIDGTFTFKALNVYFNAPVDANIVSAIPVGSANTIRFFIDQQRSQQRGSFETLDWPILLGESPVNSDGSVTVSSPANVPLFEQIRTSQASGYTIPLTHGLSPNEMPGAGHVAGFNFGRTGDVVMCVGCHAGHSMIPVPANPADAQWTNLAPGATVTYSSLHTSLPNGNGAVDRKVKLRQAYNNNYRYWLSGEGQNPNSQWLQLTFPVPVTVRTVRLYNIPATESSIKVLNTVVSLYSDAAGSNQVVSNTSGVLSESGTDVAFNNVSTRVVRIQFTSVSGATAGLGEVEVIASAAKGISISGNAGVANVILKDQNGVLGKSSSGGSYSLIVPNNWSGTITPNHACYAFSPINRTYTNLISNQTLQDFSATYIPSSYIITGNVGISGVLLNYIDGTPKAVTSDANGNYSITVPCGWNGTVNPSLTNPAFDLGFMPSGKTYTDVTANQNEQNYMPYRLFSDLRKWTSAFDLAHGWTVTDFVRTVGDANGDGKVDVIGFGLDGVYVATSNGAGFESISKWTSAFDLSHGWTVRDYVRTVGDVNGDGKIDLVGFGLDGVYVALSNGTGFDAVSKWTSAFDLSHGWTVKDYVRTLGDVNGDGRDDLIGFGHDGVYVALALNPGPGFGSVSKWSGAFDLAHGWTVRDYVRTVGDINGDGKSDLIGYGLDGVYISLSTGAGFGSINRWTTNFNYIPQGWTVNKHPRLVGDADGDGKDDLVGFGTDGVWVDK